MFFDFERDSTTSMQMLVHVLVHFAIHDVLLRKKHTFGQQVSYENQEKTNRNIGDEETIMAVPILYRFEKGSTRATFGECDL